jgi:hypothetical protein
VSELVETRGASGSLEAEEGPSMIEWRVDRERQLPEVGKIYRVQHARKGVFTARMLLRDDEMAEVEIVSGSAKMASMEGNATAGEIIAIRASLCQLYTPEGQ